MESICVGTLAELNVLLREKNWLANGKNFQVNHLHETVANSRWQYENIQGIYLTNQDYVWMALWMAITLRKNLKKRQIRYHKPIVEKDDYIGAVEVYNPEGLTLENLFCREAYLYLFNEKNYLNIPVLDISKSEGKNKIVTLLENGFREEKICKNRNWQIALKPNFNRDKIVLVDEWQVSLVNFLKIIPDREVILSKSLIDLLTERIKHSQNEIGNDYLK